MWQIIWVMKKIMIIKLLLLCIYLNVAMSISLSCHSSDSCLLQLLPYPDIVQALQNIPVLSPGSNYSAMSQWKEEMMEYKKLDQIKCEDCRCPQSYMFQKSLAEARMEFIWKCDMLDTRTTMKWKYEKGQMS